MHIFSWRGLRFTRFRFTPEVLNLVWFVKYLFAFTIFGGIDISIKMSNAYTSHLLLESLIYLKGTVYGNNQFNWKFLIYFNVLKNICTTIDTNGSKEYKKDHMDWKKV